MDFKKHVADADLARTRPVDAPARAAKPLAITDADQDRLIQTPRKSRLARFAGLRLAVGLGAVLALAMLAAAGFVTTGVEAGQ